MKLGLIGHPLGHSWSPTIHQFFIHEEYEKWDLEETQFDSFMKAKDFDGINVTIPYKQAVLPYLEECSDAAKAIGAVNCIVNKDGKLHGYNTDVIGFSQMLENASIEVQGKQIAVLGSGGASKAVSYALKQMQAQVDIVSRKDVEGFITYEHLYQQASNYDMIVNTTPVGMYPNTDAMPIELDAFTNCKVVVDVVANPLRTKLLFEAKCRGMKTLGGFEMLVRQAFAADEFFLGKKLDSSLNLQCMNAIYHKKRNIVLIGMPTCGKTTITQILAARMDKEVIEMDREIEENIGMQIKDCFAQYGEEYFREREYEEAIRVSQREGVVISCGGGVIKQKKTMQALSENGIVIYVQRDVKRLYSTDTRPLTGDEEYMRNLFQQRKPLYEMYSDFSVVNDDSLDQVVTEIITKLGGE